jgi:hypothetical protein
METKMIVDKPGSHFIFIVPWDHMYRHYNYINYKGKELTNKEYLEYWGKWIILGTRQELDNLAKEIDPYIEKRKIPAAKYDREEIRELQIGECVMCVYCDIRDRDRVWNILSSLGIKKKAWVSERETMERWLPGGNLLETWIEARGLSAEEAKRVREDSRKRFEKMFENEYAIFRGIDQ